MRKAQVFLHEEQKEKLQALSKRTGKRQSELIRKGVDLVIEAEQKRERDWRKNLEAIHGIWRDRDNLDDFFEGIRTDLSARHEKLTGHDAD